MRLLHQWNADFVGGAVWPKRRIHPTPRFATRSRRTCADAESIYARYVR